MISVKKCFAAITLVTLSIVLYTSAVYAQRGYKVVSAKSGSENRVALIIGNSAYKSSPLRNPKNDARDMASSLRDAGFTVILKINANQRTMRKAIRDFGNKISGEKNNDSMEVILENMKDEIPDTEMSAGILKL